MTLLSNFESFSELIPGKYQRFNSPIESYIQLSDVLLRIEEMNLAFVNLSNKREKNERSYTIRLLTPETLVVSGGFHT